MTNETQLDWHAAFFAALQAELIDYQDVLQFEQEHPLNENPLRIDKDIVGKVIDMTAEQTTEIWGEALEKNGYNQKIKNEGKIEATTTLANEARELFEKGIDPSEILRIIISKASPQPSQGTS